MERLTPAQQLKSIEPKMQKVLFRDSLRIGQFPSFVLLICENFGTRTTTSEGPALVCPLYDPRTKLEVTLRRWQTTTEYMDIAQVQTTSEIELRTKYGVAETWRAKSDRAKALVSVCYPSPSMQIASMNPLTDKFLTRETTISSSNIMTLEREAISVVRYVWSLVKMRYGDSSTNDISSMVP